MNKTTLCLLTFTFLTLSCGQTPVQQERGPASVETPSLWGKPVNPKGQDFLDDIENAPSRKYKGTYSGKNN